MHIGLFKLGYQKHKEHSISVYQARYVTSVAAKYLDTATIKEHPKFHNTTLPHYMIFTKKFTSNSF